MKIITILSALLLGLVIAGAARAAITDAAGPGPARGTENIVAYGADTVCKLGCWG